MNGESCRSCGAPRTERFYTVRAVPLHSCLVMRDPCAARDYPTGDVELSWCARCGFIQNDLFEPERVDYGAGYEDSQAYSPRWVSWARGVVADLADRYGLRGGRALEIGCGKGDFLALLASVAAMEGIGYDPAFRPGPLVPEVVDRLTFHRKEFTVEDDVSGADLICVRHVLEHVADPAGFLAMVREAIGDAHDTMVLFEVPGSERILDELAFWDVYYEHCSYFTADSLRAAFERAGFEVVAVRSAFDGQYLLLEARPAAVPSPHGPRAADRTAIERFGRQVPERVAELRGQLRARADQGGRTVLWGAGSKAVGCLTTLGLSDEVVAVVDIDPWKQGGFLAGTGHPVVGPAELARVAPTHVVAMNPTYQEEIAKDLEQRHLTAEVRTL